MAKEALNKNDSLVQIFKLIDNLDEFVTNKYGGQLHVEVEDIGYTIYAKYKDDLMCIGCGRDLRAEFKRMDVLNQGRLGNPIVFIVQCFKCNETLMS